ncbi:MAG: hypothetical protein QNJ33_18810 [Crocosphaera sp.]|nr:hypothetical protein [Crocosphaera sp.]
MKLLQEKELEEAYRDASTEVDEDWDMTIGDGLNVEREINAVS